MYYVSLSMIGNHAEGGSGGGIGQMITQRKHVYVTHSTILGTLWFSSENCGLVSPRNLDYLDAAYIADK